MPKRWAFLLSSALLAIPLLAQADEFKLRYPNIEYRELELEHNLTLGHGATFTHEVEYGFLPELKLGVEGEWKRSVGEGLHFDAVAVEGYWQITPQGKYWADLSLFAEYEHTARIGDPRALFVGPLIQKEVNFGGLQTLHTVNFLFKKEMGMSATGTPAMRMAAQSRVQLDPHFEPGFEYYGDLRLGRNRGDKPEHRIGPVVVGRVPFREIGVEMPGGIKYEAGAQVGLNKNTEPMVGRFRLELEFPL